MSIFAPDLEYNFEISRLLIEARAREWEALSRFAERPNFFIKYREEEPSLNERIWSAICNFFKAIGEFFAELTTYHGYDGIDHPTNAQPSPCDSLTSDKG